jgi:hypothetical protein
VNWCKRIQYRCERSVEPKRSVLASHENIRHRQVQGMSEAVGHLHDALPVGQRGPSVHQIELQSQLLEEGSRIRNID